MGSFPWAFNSSLHLEKCLHPRNPRCADKGDGWTDFNKWCFLPFTTDAFFWAYEPHNRNTTPLQWSLMYLTTALVIVSQPWKMKCERMKIGIAKREVSKRATHHISRENFLLCVLNWCKKFFNINFFAKHCIHSESIYDIPNSNKNVFQLFRKIILAGQTASVYVILHGGANISYSDN